MDLTFSASDVRLLEDEDAYSGHYRLHRVTLEHRRFDGSWSQPISRELFERGDAVGVLLWDPQRDELVMLEQFRAGAMRGDDSPWMLELVAGVVEAGESDADVAHRETAEESGLSLTALEPIVSFFPSPGACTEQVRLFMGRVDSEAAGGVHGCAHEGEDILLHRLSRADVMAMLDDNRINNGHTLIALQWLRIHGDALRERWT